MTKFKKFLFCLMGLTILTVMPLAHAQNAPEPEDSSSSGHGGQRIQQIYNQLQLTDTQKQQLEANKQQHRAMMRAIRQQMRACRQAFKEELMKPQLDMAQINDIHVRIKALQSQLEDDKFGSIIAVRTILTPEQFARFTALMRQYRQERSQ